MAGTVSSDALSVPDRGQLGENIMRPASRASTQNNGGTTTPTQSSYRAPLNPPSRTNSRASAKWNGKHVVININLPTDIRDENGVDVATGRLPVFTKEELLEKLRSWERMGYTIQAQDVSDGQTRIIYPEEYRGPLDKMKINVNIPDKKKWEAYVEALREEKLRALGVLLGDAPPTAPSLPTNSRGPTPLVPLGITTFTPPPAAAATIGNHQFNAYSPIGTPQSGFHLGHMPSPSMAPAGFGHFHNPRQSISFQGGMPGLPMVSPGANEWESYPMNQNAHGTPPIHGPGWNSPFGRGGSPALPQGFNNMNNMNNMNNSNGLNIGFNNGFTPGYVDPPMMSPISEFAMPEGIVQNSAQAFSERLQQQHQQMRRGSPLAHVREVSIEEGEPVLPLNKFVIPQPEATKSPGPKLVEPVPKHRRNQPSVSLQREMEGVENIPPPSSEQLEKEKSVEKSEENIDGFLTNPTSPAPPGYLNEQQEDTVQFPEQPDIPAVEDDVHNGEELASNPDDGNDIADGENAAKTKEETTLKNTNLNLNTQTQDKPQFDLQKRVDAPPFYPSGTYTHPHSHANSLSHTASLQLDYDSIDPIQHSAMAMLGMNGDIPHHIHDGELSEDAKTNISDIETNPSVSGSPALGYSIPSGNNSNPWAGVNNPEPPKSILNGKVSEFKYDPNASFNFAPKPKEPNGVFGAPTSFNVAAPAFTPGGNFNFKASSFNPSVPTFTPSFTAPNFPEVPFVKPPPVKKIIPIVRPPSRKEEVEEPDLLALNPKSQEGVRKRTKNERGPSTDEEHILQPPLDTVVEQSTKAPAHQEVPKSEEAVNRQSAPVPVDEEVSQKTNNEESEEKAKNEDKLGSDHDESGNEVVEEEISSDEAEELVTKAPAEVVSKDFNPYELKALGFHNSRPSTTFDIGRAKNVRTPDTPEENTHGDLSVDQAHFALLNSTLDEISPPPEEEQPPPPPNRRSSLHPGAAEFSFDFKAKAEPFIPNSQMLDLNNKAASTRQSEDKNDLSEAESETMEPELSFGKTITPTAAELDDVFMQLDEAEMPYLSHPDMDEDELGEDEVSEEETDDQELENEEDEELDESMLPWMNRNQPRRPAIPDFVAPVESFPQYADTRKRGVGPSPGPYRHNASTFSPDEDAGEVRPIGAYRPPDLPPAEKYRSTAIGITGKASGSDWDDALSEGGSTKLRPQSRLFFDNHVEELVGALLKTHIEPLGRSLSVMQHLLTQISNAQTSSQSRRRAAPQITDSDADDEDDDDDDDSLPPRSRKGDRKMEKMKLALLEALNASRVTLQPVPLTAQAPLAPTKSHSAHPSISGADSNANEAISKLVLNATTNLEIKLESHKADMEDALKQFQTVLEKGQAGNLRVIMPTLNVLQDTLQESLKERESIIRKATSDIEVKIEEESENLTSAINVQLEDLDIALHSTKQDIENLTSAVNRGMSDTKERLDGGIVKKQDELLEVSRGLEEKLLDYSMITVENNKALEANLVKRNDAILQSTRNLAHRLDQTDARHDAMFTETRNIVQRMADATRTIESKMQDRDRVVHDATKNLENRLHERDMAMVMDARDFIEERLKERDAAIINVTKNLNDKLSNRDASVIGDLSRSLDERLQERDRAVLDATRSLEEKLQERDAAILEATKRLESRLHANNDISSVLEATRALEDKLDERDSAFAQATMHLEERLQHRDELVTNEITGALAERLNERDVSLIEDTLRRWEEKYQKAQEERDSAFARATAHLEEKLAHRDELVTNDITHALAERLNERDVALIEDTMKSLEERLQQNDRDMMETRKSIEKLINRDHEGLVEITSCLEDALKQRDISMSAEAAAAFQSLEGRVMERENNDSLIHELRGAIQEMLDRQSRMLEANVVQKANQEKMGQAESEELHKRLGVLESLLEEARATARHEADLRRQVQEKAVEFETRLRMAEDERDHQKELAYEAEDRLKASDDSRHQALAQSQMRSALLEGAHSSLQKSVSELSARNAMLEGQLQQANAAGERLSGEHGQAHNENRELRRTIENLRSEMEESIRVREGFRGKFNRLQEDMRTASAEIGKEQARWARRDEEQKARIDVLEARLAAEAKSKENLEREIERLRGEESQAIRLKVELEHVRRHADKMENLSDRIREENIEQQRRIALLQVDLEASRQATNGEVSRATAGLQRDLQAARIEAENAKAKQDAMLDEVVEAQKVAVAAAKEEALQAQAAALQEQHQKYERQLEELRAQNERALATARQDAEREQAFLRQNLNMARNQSEHQREKIAHLEDRLHVATSAAQAAAKAAREAKANPRPEARGSNTEEKVSPQALRESIVALQEQLGEREARVEELEQKLAGVEKETSKKLKDSDFEIGWLRELLSERISELEEISSSLQSPTYSRDVVREAAVRLKTNLQMEQQVRERQQNGNAEFGNSLASVAGGLAKQIPLAWGSWRKTKPQEENTHIQPSPSVAPTRPTATPQQSSGFLSGFLTPPTMASARSRISGFGGTEQLASKRPRPPLDMSGYSTAPGSATTGGPVRRSHQHLHQQPPVTNGPQYLTRRGSYDDDADVSVLGFYDDDGSANGAGDAAAFGDDLGDDVAPFRTGAYLSG